MEEKVVRKTTVKRTTRKTVASEKAAPRPRAVRKTAESSVVRKAPPRVVVKPVSVPPTKGKKRAKVLLFGLPLFLVLLGVSALIGMTDKGELDVASAITQRKQSATSDEEKQALESVPTEQIQPASPNGGLVGMGAPEPVPVVPEVTASSIPESASSTPETVSEEGTVTETQEPEAQPEPSEPQASEQASGATVEA